MTVLQDGLLRGPGHKVWPSFFDWRTSRLFHLLDRQAKMTALRLRCRGEGDTRDRLSGKRRACYDGLEEEDGVAWGTTCAAAPERIA